MMLKSKSNPWMRTKALYIIPVATIAISVFATPELNNQVSAISEAAQSTIEGKGTNNFAINQVSEPEIVAAKKKTHEIANDDKDRMAEILKRKMQMEKEKVENHNQKVFDVVEVMPEYPGGINELLNYLTSSIKFPEKAKGAKARVIVTFVVEKDGSVNNVNTVQFKAENEISEEGKNAIIEESERVVSNMSKWTPGKQSGENVAVNYTLPITFIDNPEPPKEQEVEDVVVNLILDK